MVGHLQTGLCPLAQVPCPEYPFALCPSSKGDIVDPNLKSQFNTYKLPALVKRILAIILKPIVSMETSHLCYRKSTSWGTFHMMGCSTQCFAALCQESEGFQSTIPLKVNLVSLQGSKWHLHIQAMFSRASSVVQSLIPRGYCN